ncbi:receptor protein kinase-like protein ZAR1 [Cryptomeria japonica]|uniref:receptor protein kinase-like protein ZAR1 n=1 Tax=Cryptomeria japonica TaxID=3369 RepID=UPI0027DA6B71|nr:receptor protein kinase-like protein ZAR1 [Cryptomeria japonica]XP_059075929.1 receptor protein kinase-like protein ZAR1 [Cryptomeria japonica]
MRLWLVWIVLELWFFWGVWSLNSDGLSLLAFKAAMNSDPMHAFIDWNENDAIPCNWTGVSCMTLVGSSDPRVVGLTVTAKGLEGYIPSELGALEFLRRLNLHGNRLNGAIPIQLFNASALHSIFLYENNLTGPIPVEVTRLPRLQNLDLSSNSLSGPIPKDFTNCKQLQRLLLQNNFFTGPIPAGLGSNLYDLEQLDLSSNRLNDSIPEDLGNLSSLVGTLNLSYNRLSGPIPRALGKLPLTVSLDVRNNNLTGPIPQDGSLANQGPTAFVNNPGLCGFPLKTVCQNPVPTSPSPANLPSPQGRSDQRETSTGRKGLTTGVIIAISVGDAVGIALVGMLFVYLYWKTRICQIKWCSCTGKNKLGGGGASQCFCGNRESSDTASEKGDQGDLIPIDKAFSFELDELLRASAYVLGKSGLGIVYKVVLGSGVPVAVRRLGEGGAQRFKEFEAEVQAIGRIRHPNIVKLRAYYWAADEKLLIYDFIPNGSLATALHGKSGHTATPLPWAVRLKIIKGIAQGLAHLHECSPRKYVHGDIKPTNVLLDGNMQPQISDFGLGRLINIAGSGVAPQLPGGILAGALPSGKTSVAARGSSFPGGVVRSAADWPASGGSSHSFVSNYQAPEASTAGHKPTQKWDVYSFGVVLLEVLTGRSPAFQLASFDMDLVTWVRKAFEEEHPLSEIVDPTLLQEVYAKKEVLAVFHIALACVEIDPDLRPRMKNVSESLDRIGATS